MIYNDCPLFKLQSKRHLKRLLGIKNDSLIKQGYIASQVSPYIDVRGKPRLIEPPSNELKAVQRRIKNMLGKIIVPDNVFSGVKGRSYVGNALIHTGDTRRILYKIDLTAFFPSIKRETVFRFFLEDMACSPDVSRILTDLTTIDIERANVADIDRIDWFLRSKNVSCKNHLISGAPTSQIMSFLVNHHMFEELQSVADENGAVMTVYVDDVFFSSDFWISHRFRERIKRIVKKYGYQISKEKIKLYTRLYPKLVTGVVISSKGKAVVKNSVRKRIIDEYLLLREHPDDVKSRQKLRGLLTAARQVDCHAYPAIYQFAFCNET